MTTYYQNIFKVGKILSFLCGFESSSVTIQYEKRLAC